jgi:hypothetical protein
LAGVQACAALLQDEQFVYSAYTAETPEELLNSMDMKMHKITMLPHIHRPTMAGDAVTH